MSTKRIAYTPGYDPDDDDDEWDGDDDDELYDVEDDDEDDEARALAALQRRVGIPYCADCGGHKRWQRGLVPSGDLPEGVRRRVWLYVPPCGHYCPELLQTHLYRARPVLQLVMVPARDVQWLGEWRRAVDLENVHEWREEVRLDA